MPVGTDGGDELIELAVRALLDKPGQARLLVRDLVLGRPDLPALDLIYILAMAAGSLEGTFAGPDVERASQDAWRMAGLIGTDLSMMRHLGLPHDTAADLLAYWKVHDRFFLD